MLLKISSWLLMKKIKIYILIHICLFFLCSTIAPAQSHKQDVLYLKNGSVLRGFIISNPQDSIIRIKLQSTNVMAIHKQEIEKFTQEKFKKEHLFHDEIHGQKPKIRFASNFLYAAGIHTNYQSSKTTIQNLQLDAGMQFRNGFLLSAGFGMVNYRNLSTKSILISKRPEYNVWQYNRTNDNPDPLNQYNVFINLSKPLFKRLRKHIEIGLKAGFFIYNPDTSNVLLFYSRRNNQINYEKSYVVEYLNRPFISPTLNIAIPILHSKKSFIFGVSYLLDFVAMKYNFTERKFIYPDYGYPTMGYWETTTFMDKIRVDFGSVLIQCGFRF